MSVDGNRTLHDTPHRTVGPAFAWLVALALLAPIGSARGAPQTRGAGSPGPQGARPRPSLFAIAVESGAPLARLLAGKQKGASYVGSERCLECHQTHGQEWRGSLVSRYRSSHTIRPPERRGCEGCHGPGSEHSDGEDGAIIDPRELGKAQVSVLCTSCHDVRRRIGDPDYHQPGHSASHVGCLDCHRAHRAAGPRSLRDEPNRLCLACHQEVGAQFALRSRHPLKAEGKSTRFSIREGKVACIDCHRPYSASEDPAGRETAATTCSRCHAETRGPFLFAHDGGSEIVSKGCLACHHHHGSPNRHLLRTSGRSNCIVCHTDQAAGHRSGPTCTTTGCHRDIHGSNQNQFFLR